MPESSSSPVTGKKTRFYYTISAVEVWTQQASDSAEAVTSVGETAASLLPELFRDHGDILSPVRKKADAVRNKIEAVDGFIGETASLVCPSCVDACCKDAYAFPHLSDLIYMYALGLTPPLYTRDAEGGDPCQFLGPSGCVLARSLRPFRCTWFFCDPFLEVMERLPAKRYRTFVESFHKIIELRREMTDEFFNAAPLIPFTTHE